MDAPFSRSKQIAAEQDDGEAPTIESHTRSREASRSTASGAASPTLRAAIPDALKPGVEPSARRSSKPRYGGASQPIADEPSQPVACTPRELTPSTPPASSTSTYAAGSVIADKYKLEREIGSGGMGSVWLAHNRALDVDVAIKLIRRDRTTAEAKARLLQEARTTARIGHSSIVRIYDFGESAEGDPFIVMELLDGEPLRSLLARKRTLPPAVAVRTLLPVASALVAAHAKGIVHRDLKPDNILLVTNEVGAVVPKIVDFGIARLVGADVGTPVTRTGEVLGSPDYMSPEQARGEEDIGEATDVWAFAVMLYEALTGNRPFTGANYNALLMHIVTAEPTPVTQLGIDDEELWLIIARGLAKDISRRWRSMREMGKALATWAMARGFGDDVAGTALGKHWLSGSRRRTLSVRPSGALPAALLDAPPLALPPPPRLPDLSLSTPLLQPPVPVLTTGARLGARIPPTLARTWVRWQTALAVALVVLIVLLGRALLRGPSVPASDVLAVPANEASGANGANGAQRAPNVDGVALPEMPAHAAPPPAGHAAPAAPALDEEVAEMGTAPAASSATRARSGNPAGVRQRPLGKPATSPAPRRVNF